MASQMTVRLPDDLGEILDTLARRMRLRRSDVVRMAIRRLAEEMDEETGTRPYDRVRHLLGSVRSGIPDLGRNHRKHLVKKLGRDA
jgi:Arc/MetJ-type ribon-helix-helix transcriptional regulator